MTSTCRAIPRRGRSRAPAEGAAAQANTLPPSRATGGPPAARIDEERARLRSLKIARAELALRIPVSVSPTGAVINEGHPYSMPPDALGLPAMLDLDRDRAGICARGRL